MWIGNKAPNDNRAEAWMQRNKLEYFEHNGSTHK